MDNAKLIAAAIAEIEQPTFGVTEQFLEIHSVSYSDGNPKVVGVIVFDDEKKAIVYFAVEKEKFYLAIYLDTTPALQVSWVGTEDYYRVCFQAYSEALTLQELSALTALKPTGGHTKGDQRKFGGGRYPGSSLEFYLNPAPNTFESKLEELLMFLEQDALGIRVLADCTESCIAVIAIFHNGNTMLGGVHLDRDVIKRLAALNLEIDFDLYAEGNLFKN